jgi:hypothetical protein
VHVLSLIQNVYRYFPQDTTNNTLYRNIFSSNYLNLMKIIRPSFFFQKNRISCFRFHKKTPTFGIRMFIFTGHRSVTDEHEYNSFSFPEASDACIHTADLPPLFPNTKRIIFVKGNLNLSSLKPSHYQHFPVHLCDEYERTKSYRLLKIEEKA